MPLRLVRAPHLALVGLVVVAVGVGLPALPAGRPCGVTAALWVSVFGFRFSVSACRTKNTDRGMRATSKERGTKKKKGAGGAEHDGEAGQAKTEAITLASRFMGTRQEHDREGGFIDTSLPR